MQELARTLEKSPGFGESTCATSADLPQLLRERPEIGSIELKGFFGTGVVITRTQQGGVARRGPLVPATAATARPPPRAPAALTPPCRPPPRR